MAKTVEISGKSFKRLSSTINSYLKKAQSWVKNFFKTIDMYETIAVGAMGLGLVLIIAGSIMI